MLRWLAVAGAVLTFVGSLVMVSDYWWSSFHSLLSNVSAFGRAESGWEKLGQFEYQDKNGKAYGRLGDDETGFRKLKAIILGKRPEYRERQISVIISTEGMAYNLGEGTVAQKYVYLLTEGQSVPDVVAPEEQVEGWISEARVRFVLFFGFAFLLVVFVLSFPASVQHARSKPK